MTTRKQPVAMTTKSKEPSSTRPRRSLNASKVQNFHLVWLDESIDEDNNDNCRNSIIKLRQVINTVNTFTDVDECIDFITDIKEEKVFMIISVEFSQIIISVVQEISQVSSIYIFCENKAQHEEWAQQCPKVKAAYTDITSICETLKKAAQDCDRNSVSIGFVKAIDGASNQNLNELDKSFMYTQIMKEILLTIDFQQQHIDELLEYCREQFASNSVQLNNSEKLRKEYHDHQPIWWYTSPCFLYSMLNRALRLMEVDLIVKMGFFLRDLHKHIAVLHAEQYGGHHHSDTFIVYRGQGLSQIDFDQLVKTKGGLMSFNNFLSTSLDRAVSFLFAESNQNNPDLIGVLFEITVSPSISSSPFANIKDASYYQEEEEILFSMHSIFRIGQIKQIDKNNRLWQVDLTLTSDNDPQLHALTECMREETRGSTEWFRLGQLMIKLGQFNKAEELYETLMKQPTNEDEKGRLYHMLGVVKDGQGNYTEAVAFFENSIKIKQEVLSSNHSGLTASYNNIGGVYKNMGEYSKALSYYEKALEIWQKTYPPNYSNLASSYNNIGLVYKNMGEYSKALSYYEKDLEISQKALPANHPSLATSYNNLGDIYENMGEHSKALSYFEKSFEILQKILPANHPYLAFSYHNIGSVYSKTREYTKAVSYYEKALDIGQKTLPMNHSDLATFYNNIGLLYNNMGEHSKALSFNEKALEIRQKTLPENHPHLATSYNNIGGVYDGMGEYSKALPYFEKALEIRQKTLPENHPDFTQSYNNIGGVYNDMGEYSKALSSYEKLLVIRQKTLPENHPDFTQSYNSIGAVYMNMREYSKAVSYYEKALAISQKTLPVNHAELATSYINIGGAYFRIGDCAKALSYFERALDIQQRSLRPDHPHLKSLIQCIETVKKKL
jgi:tetratricopeptide (TPR) repeat protein